MPGAVCPPERAPNATSQLTEHEFRQWKVAQMHEQGKPGVMEQEAQRRADVAAGHIPIEELTGRELAEHHPEVFEGY